MDAYKRISRYRSELMGAAILMVVYGHLFYYHSGLQAYNQLNPTVWYLGVGSVDVFMFLSGFGIFQSLNRDDNPLRFFVRRMRRLLPSFLPVILLYCIFALKAGWINKYQVLGNLTTFGWWAQQGGQFNWYIPAIIALYLLSPLFYHVIMRYGRRALWVIPLLFLGEAGAIGSSLMIGVSRFPVYFLGMYLGWEALQNHSPSQRHLLISGIVMVLSMLALAGLVICRPEWLSRFGFWWHPFFFSTPGCLYLTSWCMEKQGKWIPTRWLNQGLRFFGERSFEIYLWHLMVFSVALYMEWESWGVWLLMTLVGIACGCVYHALIKKIISGRKL